MRCSAAVYMHISAHCQPLNSEQVQTNHHSCDQLPLPVLISHFDSAQSALVVVTRNYRGDSSSHKAHIGHTKDKKAE